MTTARRSVSIWPGIAAPAAFTTSEDRQTAALERLGAAAERVGAAAERIAEPTARALGCLADASELLVPPIARLLARGADELDQLVERRLARRRRTRQPRPDAPPDDLAIQRARRALKKKGLLR